MPAVPVVSRGSLLAYRVFDAGDTIALDVAERLVPSAKRVELGGPLAEGLVIAVPALEIALPACDLVIPGIDRPLAASVTARIFHFGVVSVLYEVPIAQGTPLPALIPLCGALYESPALDARGAQHLDEVLGKLATSVEKPHEWHETESYTIVFVQELGGVGIDALVDSESIAKLLLGETSDKPLSAATRQDVLRNGFSYLADDLVLIDWNSALVVEPSGSRIVPHVLELATSQLLEFRYYDGLLDRELARVYEHVGRAPRIFR
ncbi:MAG: hypothetical protein KF795_26115, partial [Labilithrix sp.]|nr:hypothetical protein [Labilithrix sp.]